MLWPYAPRYENTRSAAIGANAGEETARGGTKPPRNTDRERALLFGREPWWPLALSATAAGLAIGAAAIMTGLLEYMQPSLAGIDMRLAARHGTRTALAWCTFMAKIVAALFLPATYWAIAVCLVLDLIGCAVLIQGVFFGTRQVYEQLEKD